jgi:hypothetical protein
MVAASIAMPRSRGDHIPSATAAPMWVVFGAGLALGFLTGFLGVGGGFLIVPTMVFAFGCSMHTATSLLVIAFNAFVALATRFATASVDWSVVAAFLAGNTAASMLVHRLDQRRLKRIFAVFTLMVGLFTAASATGLIPIRIM